MSGDALPIARALLVLNPASRKGARRRAAVEQVLRERDVALDVLTTQHPGHATELVRERGLEHDAIFVLGGDGTVMETVTALAGTGRPVGVLPGGTGNLIAGALGIPRHAPDAVRSLLAGHVRRLDLGRFTAAGMSQGYFAFAAGLGIDVATLTGTTRAWKRRLGVLAYVWSAVRAALRREEFNLFARIDGAELRTTASLVMVVNSGTLFGGAFLIGPGISANDGTLDLCVFSPRSALDCVRIALRLWRGNFRPHPQMRYLKGRCISIVSEPVHVVQADGELIGQTPMDFEVAPQAASFLVPR